MTNDIFNAMAAGASAVVAAALGIYTPPRIDIIKGGLRTTLLHYDETTKKSTLLKLRDHSAKPWGGFLIHTCGSGPAKDARLKGTTLAEEINRVYSRKSMTCAHAVSMPDYSILRCVPDHLVAPHCGVTKEQRLKLLNGSWRAQVSDLGEKFWDARWPGVKSPQHLFPTASGNDWFFGLEHAQLDVKDPETGTKFNDLQYKAAAWLMVSIERKNKFICVRSFKGRTTYATHEDLQPFERWSPGDDGQPWDPGVMRVHPTYDEARLFRWVEFWRKAPPEAFA